MLIETPPSIACFDINMQKRPGVHMLGCVQAIAHGSDSAMYFQWRKGRGCSEKMHGAVVDHCGHENTRVFREVSEVGKRLTKLEDVLGTPVNSEVAVIFDWNNKWILDALRGMSNETGGRYTAENNDKKYPETCVQHYRAFWSRGINVDVIGVTDDFKKYKLIIAHMLHMATDDMIAKIKEYVSDGGCFVGTYAMGEVNENALCYMGGFPAGELKDVFGIWAEEVDTLYPEYSNSVRYGSTSYTAKEYCEVIHTIGSQTIAEYEQDCYKNMPAVTANQYGKGKAYYIAFRDTGEFTDSFYALLIEKLDLTKNISADIPAGCSAHIRTNGTAEYIFIENYNNYEVNIVLHDVYTDVDTNEGIRGNIILQPYSVNILKK